MEIEIQCFNTTRKDISGKAKDQKIATLENTIKHKDEVTSELAQELLKLKKELWQKVI